MRSPRRRLVFGIVFSTAVFLRGVAPAALAAEAAAEPLRIIVMDPLALPLSCTCVEGTGQRRYEVLGEYLGDRLGRKVEIVFEESVGLALHRLKAESDLIVGKRSMILADAVQEEIGVRPIAELTDKTGSPGLRGVFLIRKDDPAKSLRDLAGRTIALGPLEDEETHRAARLAIREAGLEDTVTIQVAGSIDAAALAANDGEADVAVVSAFMPAMLEGCGKIDRGTMRILAETKAVPFVTVFATDAVSKELGEEIVAALESVAGEEELLAVMESSKGFKAVRPVEFWTDWRGAGRRGISPSIPAELPAEPERLWTAELTGPAMAGVAATDRFVVVPDKDAAFERDIFRCLDADTGEEIWRLDYEAAAEVDYSNAPRATPVIHEGLVYLQGAVGDLHCVDLETGVVVWKLNLFADFGAELLFWGSSCAPLVVDDLLVLNPGAKEASLVAVDRKTGKAAWKTPGHAAAYSSFIVATFDGVKQIVGYDAGSLGGWDPATGQRLWEVIPPDATDFNVTTPLALGDHILLATENNGTRLYGFDGGGKLNPEPVMVNDDLAPDTCTPVAINGRIYATAYGEMFCLDVAKDLATVWSAQDDMFYDHSNVMAGNDRVLVWGMSGDFLLIDASLGSDEYTLISKWKPFGEKKLDSMSHPAIVGDRVYLRAKGELACILLR